MTMERWGGRYREIKYWKELKGFLDNFAQSVTIINKQQNSKLPIWLICNKFSTILWTYTTFLIQAISADQKLFTKQMPDRTMILWEILSMFQWASVCCLRLMYWEEHSISVKQLNYALQVITIQWEKSRLFNININSWITIIRTTY